MDLCGGYTKETAEYTNRIFTVKKGYHRGGQMNLRRIMTS